MASLKNTKIIIIGGSTGLGFAVAQAALSDGAKVTICSSNGTRLKSAVAALGGGDRLTAEVLDVTKEADIKSFFEKSGTFDHLVHTVSSCFFRGEGNLHS
jgi:NAD(P)-dependent dehydrogenase (short-subunit alcohol dehydrogenase family)